MKQRLTTVLLLVILTLTACVNQEIRPGVYVTDEPDNLPLPTEGYRVYIIGEEHGTREAKLLFISYLKRLNKEAGLRDVILEEDQVYESAANAFVLGESDTLIHEMCLRNDILTLIREFNVTLSENEKVRVHLVDVDSPLSAIQLHLQLLREQIGAPAASIQIPELAEFETWSPAQMYNLVSALETAGDNIAVLNGLQTVHDSLRWYFLGDRMDSTTPSSPFVTVLTAPIRENVITQNIQFLLSSMGEKPLLAFFGATHGIKVWAISNSPDKGFTSWAQRIAESGVSVYSVNFFGLSGDSFWRGSEISYPDRETIQLPDGTSLGQLLMDANQNILYVDLRMDENATSILPPGYADFPAGQVYDGQVIFKVVTPMEDACK